MAKVTQKQAERWIGGVIPATAQLKGFRWLTPRWAKPRHGGPMFRLARVDLLHVPTGRTVAKSFMAEADGSMAIR